MKTTLYINREGLHHDTGPGHPERIARLETLIALFNEAPFADLPRIDAEPAELEQILRAHPESYINAIEEAVPDSGFVALDNDTIISPRSYAAALASAGGVCQAVDDIYAGNTTRAFCAGRPPGHHAEPEKPMGFCIFNNIFIGARHAQEKHGVKKIAIVDFDVHHGNGTDAMTRLHDGSILFISSHQYPLWPMTGVPEDNTDSVKNFTLKEGAGSAELRALYTEKVFPALNAFAPDLLMISAGFDAHRDDPLAGLNFLDEDFFWMTEELAKISNAHCGGKIVSVLEGGYNLDALKSAAAAHLKALTAHSQTGETAR